MPKPIESALEKAKIDEGTKGLIQAEKLGKSFTKTEEVVKGHVQGVNEAIKEATNSAIEDGVRENEKNNK